MKKHELIWLNSKISKSGDDFIQTGEKFVAIPADVENSLNFVLKPYDQDPGWFFTQIENSCSKSPWAFFCLDEEYPIAGHFTVNNQKDSGLFFSPYSKHLNPNYKAADGFGFPTHQPFIVTESRHPANNVVCQYGTLENSRIGKEGSCFNMSKCHLVF